MNTADESRRPNLADLLQAWNHHQDLRRDGADIRELAASHFALDRVRSTI